MGERHPLARLESLYGEDSPDGLMERSNLSILLLETDDMDKAEEIQIKVVDQSVRLLGSNHQETVRARLKFGVIYNRQDRTRAAEPLLHKAYGDFLRLYGDTHRDTLAAMTRMADHRHR